GCSGGLGVNFSARVVGMAASQTMLDQARGKLATGNVVLQRASAEALPLSAGCADLVFMSNVYHHFTNPARVAQECHRVLRGGGYVCVRNGMREADFPHQHFFPALAPLISSQLPARGDITRVF